MRVKKSIAESTLPAVVGLPPRQHVEGARGANTGVSTASAMGRTPPHAWVRAHSLTGQNHRHFNVDDDPSSKAAEMCS